TGSSALADKVCAHAKKGQCRWMYTEYETGEVELYDLSNGPCHEWKRSMRGDPCMLRNKAGKKKFEGVERALQSQLDRLRRTASGTRRERG
ncbi:MAG: hypothetical protein U9O18_03885, partial [Chloroflexota bacterium]|nr:hypothetical protein [Chloroflexota bacterium]